MRVTRILCVYSFLIPSRMDGGETRYHNPSETPLHSSAHISSRTFLVCGSISLVRVYLYTLPLCVRNWDSGKCLGPVRKRLIRRSHPKVEERQHQQHHRILPRWCTCISYQMASCKPSCQTTVVSSSLAWRTAPSPSSPLRLTQVRFYCLNVFESSTESIADCGGKHSLRKS